MNDYEIDYSVIQRSEHSFILARPFDYNWTEKKYIWKEEY